MDVLKSVVMYFLTTYSKETLFAILAVVTVAAINESINQLMFGHGKVKAWVAALIACCTVTAGILTWCTVADVGFSMGLTVLLFAFFPVFLIQFWLAQRLLKEPISALIARFSSTWTKSAKADRVKTKKIKIGGVTYYSYIGTDGKPTITQADPNAITATTAETCESCASTTAGKA